MNSNQYGALLLVGLLALIGLFVVATHQIAPEGKILLNNNPPAKVVVEMYGGEIIVQPIDKYGESTKATGSAKIDVSLVNTMTRTDMNLFPISQSAVRLDDFQMYYINHVGYDSNIYAVRTGVHLPHDQNLYITTVTYYPDGEDYTLQNSTLSRGDKQI